MGRERGVVYLSYCVVHVTQTVEYSTPKPTNNTTRHPQVFMVGGLWCSTIYQLYRGGRCLLVEETGVPRENH